MTQPRTPEVRTGGGEVGWWLSLLYLSLYFVPWFWLRPTATQVVIATFGLAVFLPLYHRARTASETALVAYACATLILSFVLILSGGNWTVITAFAATMAGRLRPARRAAGVLVVFGIATSAVGLGAEQHFYYWALGVFLSVMVGFATLSRAMLEDKNRALVNAQEEVRLIAAMAERERIGRDLHDLLGGTLTLMALKAELAAKLSVRDSLAARREMREVAAAAREALAEVRTAVAGMTDMTLTREIESARSALSAAGIACVTEVDLKDVDQGAGAVLAMTLREAVTNVIRHSGAETCQISVHRTSSIVQLTVMDDGDGRALRPSGGIAGAQSRLAAAGGGLSLTGSFDGTRFVAYLPVSALP
ncbi:MAG: sensor histidine kinase [Caulobacteraceae bacterium]|nr:sensor histidine kinase [Caulobacteraceae bacterium]